MTDMVHNARRAGALVAAFAAIGLGAAGCSRLDRVATGSIVPDDYRQRHPVVLANAPLTLDVFLVGHNGALDRRQSADVASFAQDYAASGQGVITALLPQAAGQEASAHATLAAIRATIVAAGVKGYLNVGSYAVQDATLAAPVRLSFSKLEARIATNCGDWPADLASGSTTKGWENRPYYNLGCSTQKALAAQVNDPRDLVRPRTEDPSDVQLRTRAIGNVRRGFDPGTFWTNRNSQIGNVGN